MNPISFSGYVEKGEGLASRLGCPTANIAVEVGTIIPGLGVYVGETSLQGEKHSSLVCINDSRKGNFLKMEVHLLNECPELEGKYLSVTLLHKMRSLVPYESDEQMKALVMQDQERARAWFDEKKDK